MKYTIVTVCLNAENTIKETIESVLQQTYKDFEYIIMDGMSNDATISIVEEFTLDHRVRIYQEKDTGLYNAMNKGIAKAKGEYILFMNSGDVFADTEVLAYIQDKLDADFVYGDVIRIFERKKILESYKRTSLFLLLLAGRMMSHQSLFVRTDIMKQMKFDESYTITADFDLVVRAYAEKRVFRYVNRTISIIDNANGISSKKENLELMRQQDDKSIKKNLRLWYYLMFVPKMFVRKVRKIFIKEN